MSIGGGGKFSIVTLISQRQLREEVLGGRVAGSHSIVDAIRARVIHLSRERDVFLALTY
jgi:hypothetical protein